MVIKEIMTNFDVYRILIDMGSLWEIMYAELFENLGLKHNSCVHMKDPTDWPSMAL